MSKLERYNGTIAAFASDAQGQERTSFGTETITDDINQQINAFFKRGWGIVGSADQPSIQDFNALGFTTTQLLAYLYQQGVAAYNPDQEYYKESVVMHNGSLWVSLVDLPDDEPTEVSVQWYTALTGLDATAELESGKVAKRDGDGTFKVSAPTEDEHPSRKLELDTHKQADKAHAAAKIEYDNVESGLVSKRVQGAIDETASRIAVLEGTVNTGLAASTTWNMDTDTYSGTPFATPAHKAMRRCMVNSAGVVNYYLDEFDSTLKEDGTPAVTNGDDGQVMVEIPQCYVRTIIRGSQVTWELSHAPLPGFELHPVFEGGSVEKVYIGAYQAVVWQASSDSVIDGLDLDNNTSRINLSYDRLYSTPGNFAMVGLTRNEFRTLARNGGYQLYEYWMWQLVQMLWITEYGDWNSQNVLGLGNYSGSLNEINGLSDQFGNYSGSVASADGDPFVTYRGIEDVWGNSGQFLDGVNINNRQMYVSTNEDTFADDIDTGDYSALGADLPSASASYIKNWQALENVFVPKVVGAGAGANTFIGDALWTEPGWRVMLVGGAATYGSTSGLSCCNVNYIASSRSRVFSSRLAKKLRA